MVELPRGARELGARIDGAGIIKIFLGIDRFDLGFLAPGAKDVVVEGLLDQFSADAGVFVTSRGAAFLLRTPDEGFIFRQFIYLLFC